MWVIVFIDDSSQAKVDQNETFDGLVVFILCPLDEDVLGFQVSVNDAFVMRGPQTLDDLPSEFEGAARRQLLGFEDAPQRNTLDMTHHEIVTVLVNTAVDDRDHTRMINALQRGCFSLKAGDEIRAGSEIRREQLECHELTGGDAVGLVDVPHRALPDLLDDIEARKRGQWGRRSGTSASGALDWRLDAMPSRTLFERRPQGSRAVCTSGRHTTGGQRRHRWHRAVERRGQRLNSGWGVVVCWFLR
jgi:hypothetical protein